eukprot:COSAG01_NODE_707_length_14133_cov_34.324093_13_plen_47_part_00
MNIHVMKIYRVGLPIPTKSEIWDSWLLAGCWLADPGCESLWQPKLS